MTPVFTRHAFTIAWSLLVAAAFAYLASLFLWRDDSHDGQSAQTDVLPEKTLVKLKDKASDSSQIRANRERPGGTGGAGKRAQEHAGTTDEIARLKRVLDVLSRENTELRERIRKLESGRKDSEPALEKRLEDRLVTSSIDREKTVGVPKSSVTVTYAPLPDDGFADAPLARSPLPLAGQKAPKRTLFAVELARNLTRDSAEKRWEAMKARHKSLLAGLEPRQTETRSRSGSEKSTVSLIAGPFQNAADAAQVCTRLRASGATCREAIFTGSRLQTRAAQKPAANQ